MKLLDSAANDRVEWIVTAQRQALSLAHWIEFAGGKQPATGNILLPRQAYAHRALYPDTHRAFEPGSEIRRSASGRLKADDQKRSSAHTDELRLGAG